MELGVRFYNLCQKVVRQILIGIYLIKSVLPYASCFGENYAADLAAPPKVIYPSQLRTMRS